MKLRHEYRYRPDGPERIWICIGDAGALHLWIQDSSPLAYGREKFFGGLECHYRAPPNYMHDKEPHHENCWVLGCPCWHDGTSLYAREVLIPFWERSPDDNERMFALMEREYAERFPAEALS